MKKEVFVFFFISLILFNIAQAGENLNEVSAWLEKILYKLKEVIFRAPQIIWSESKKVWNDVFFPIFDTIFEWIKKEIYQPIKNLFTREMDKREEQIKRDFTSEVQEIKKDLFSIWEKVKSFFKK
jgi:hypothetical protein